MRQVVKDRLARMDVEIDGLSAMYKAEMDRTGKPAPALERKIADLCEKKNAVIDAALFGSIGQTQYQIGLSDRQNNYDGALEEQQAYLDALTDAVNNNDLDAAKRYRTKLGNVNRILAIYKSALDKWVAKSERVRPDRPRTQAAYREEKKILSAQVEADPEVLAAIQQNYTGISAKPKFGSNTANISMLMRPSVEPPRDACAWGITTKPTETQEPQ